MIMRRSTKNMRVGGVCAGIAREIGWKPLETRMAFVCLTLLSALVPGLLVYCVLWTRVPRTNEW